MKDIDVVRIARRIDSLNWKITRLIREIEESDHSGATEIVEALQENCFDNPAYATHCIFHALEDQDRWKVGYYDTDKTWGIARKTKDVG